MCWRVYSVFTGKLDYQAIQNGATWCDTSPVKTFIHLGSRDDDSCQFPVWKDKKSVWSKVSAAITVGNAMSFWYPWRRGGSSCLPCVPFTVKSYTNKAAGTHLTWSFLSSVIPHIGPQGVYSARSNIFLKKRPVLKDLQTQICYGGGRVKTGYFE